MMLCCKTAARPNQHLFADTQFAFRTANKNTKRDEDVCGKCGAFAAVTQRASLAAALLTDQQAGS